MTINPKIETGLFLLMWVLVGALIILTGLSLYFSNFYQKNPIVYSNLPAQVNQAVYLPGDTLTSTISRCAKENYIVTTTRSLVNHLIYTLPPTTVTIPQGCHTATRFVFVIPKEIPSGIYHIENIVSVQIHWLMFRRTDAVHVYSKDFIIEKPNLDGDGATTDTSL